MKKLFLITLMAMLVGSLIFGACAAPAPAPAPAPTPAPKPAPAPGPTIITPAPLPAPAPTPAPVKPIIIRVSYQATAESAVGKAWLDWGRLVAERSKGRAKLEFYWSGALGDYKATLDATRAGVLDMSSQVGALIAAFLPEQAITDAPFMFATFQHFVRFYESPSFTAARERMKAYDIWNFGATYLGMGNFWNAKRPINTPEDLKGIKCRVYPGTAMKLFFEAAGALPVSMPYADVWEAIRSGVLDGNTESSGHLLVAKNYEVAKYYAIIGVRQVGQDLTVSMKLFNSYPLDIQDILLRSAKETFPNAIKYEEENFQAGLKVLKERGITVTRPDVKPFMELAKKVVFPFLEKEFGKEYIQAFLVDIEKLK